MRVPISWLRELVAIPAGEDGRAISERLVRAGLEVETVERVGEVTGPLLVGRVADFVEETASNGKTIRWCQVDVGDAEPRGIVCGAHNFSVGDHVVVAPPGTTLPGGFHITARKTYGHVSDGMICSVRELGIGDEHDGILVLDGAPAPGSDAAALLGLGDEVLDIAVTPDRGYCMSMRGIAREAAVAYGVSWSDPAQDAVPGSGEGWPVKVADPEGCDAFVARTVTGVDPRRASPPWLAQRLRASGMRPISLIVDVTNYVMLELGQPIHGYDRDRLQGSIVVRRAHPDEQLETLDGTKRQLHAEDLVIADDSGAIGVAGVMGGASTEVSDATTAVVVEAAHFAPVVVARAARRHRLPSEASKRFERGVDPRLPEAAAQRVVDLLVELGGGTAEPGATVVDSRRPPVGQPLDPDYVNRRSGLVLTEDAIRQHLEAVGCTVSDDWTVTPPSWRPDLTDPADLVEEVVRLHGYDDVPSVLPRAVPGRGLTAEQRRRRSVGRALADAGCVEVLNYPFVGQHELDLLGIAVDDPRRRMLELTNPISAEHPGLRTTLLPGLLAAVVRNLGRGAGDVALFEIGSVVRAEGTTAAPRPPVDRRPTADELAELLAAVPEQPRHVAAVLVGDREPAGWWGAGRPVAWGDALELTQVIARAAGVELDVVAAEVAPWHPGRCAAVLHAGRVVGHAGELHPRVAEAFRLPVGTAVLELDLDAVPLPAEPVRAPAVSGYPLAAQDVALVVADEVPAVEVERALRLGAGPLLESIKLFDVYAGQQLGAGRKSLAFALHFRADDRTLTAEEVATARDAAVAEAARRTGAELRS
jgi:phenylalanyl-tRNA synthetase beta chain